MTACLLLSTVQAFAGTAPVTRSSGLRTVVVARAACNQRLVDACYLWAFAALTEDVPLAVGFGWGLHDGSYGQAVTARSSGPGSSAVARSSAPASWGSSW